MEASKSEILVFNHIAIWTEIDPSPSPKSMNIETSNSNSTIRPVLHVFTMFLDSRDNIHLNNKIIN